MTDATVTKPANVIQTIVTPEPHAKAIEMQLVWYGAFNAFQIASIKNSAHFIPGQWLSAAAADQCCRLPNWTVMMADNTFWSTLLGFATQKAVGFIP